MAALVAAIFFSGVCMSDSEVLSDAELREKLAALPPLVIDEQSEMMSEFIERAVREVRAETQRDDALHLGRAEEKRRRRAEKRARLS